jgi:uncharacterized damage-inducible protein DinB
MGCTTACQFRAAPFEKENMTNTASATLPEPWLRGTLGEWPPVARAALHSLELAKEDLWKWCHPLSEGHLNQSVGDVAPVAFHLRHIARSLDRLLTYAEGKRLNQQQIHALQSELQGNATRTQLIEELHEALKLSANRIEGLASVDLQAPRTVGKKHLPTTLGGLLVHVAEHTQRHVGQAITLARIVAAR